MLVTLLVQSASRRLPFLSHLRKRKKRTAPFGREARKVRLKKTRSLLHSYHLEVENEAEESGALITSKYDVFFFFP